jgi:hypothetical protein
MLSQSLLQLRAVILHPAPDGCVIDMETALLQQFLNIAQGERIAKTPPDRTNYEAGFGLPPFEDRGSGSHFAILSRHQPTTLKVATHRDGSIRSPEWALAHADHTLPLDGPERREEGEWTFGYALEGRAGIDVWQVPPRAQLGGVKGVTSHECGLCVRVYDPRLKLWRFTFHGPVNGVTINMLAFAVGPDIVQERVIDMCS